MDQWRALCLLRCTEPAFISSTNVCQELGLERIVGIGDARMSEVSRNRGYRIRGPMCWKCWRHGVEGYSGWKYETVIVQYSTVKGKV